jgi:hypothetical protein
MASNVRKRAAEAVDPRGDEASVPGTGAGGTVRGSDAKNGSETPQSPNPWPAEFGWDFPFDFPKRNR